jgi:DNA (cytosine-5)-methyltransferase 1
VPLGGSLRIAGLFAGIGGIELGLGRAGHHSTFLCEIDPGARLVLEARFGFEIAGDVRELDQLPKVDLVAAGFPCQDLSQAGRTKGISGSQSSLVEHVFRLVAESGVRWLLLENVPFMLQLERGRAMRYLTERLSDLGYTWAYRVVDARSFGTPQRRQRVILLASREEDPRAVLFADEAGEPEWPDPDTVGCGFYWTEGVRGLGWAVDAVPTLKGGSSLGIPSPPAIRLPVGGAIVTPDIRDAERLQGFDPDWTLPALESVGTRRGARWKLVGNAVNVPVAKWVGERLQTPGDAIQRIEVPVRAQGRWPNAAWGCSGEAYEVDLSPWPVRRPHLHLLEFLNFEPALLSARATTGFLSRAAKSRLRFPPGLITAIEAHLATVQPGVRAA